MKPRRWQRLLPKRRRRRLNIHAKVLTIAIFPALVVTLILVVVVYRSSILQGHQALYRQAQMLTAQLAATLEYALSSGATAQLPATVENTVRPAMEVLQTRVESVQVFDPHDQVLYTAPPIGGMPKQTDTLFLRLDRHPTARSADVFSADLPGSPGFSNRHATDQAVSGQSAGGDRHRPH